MKRQRGVAAIRIRRVLLRAVTLATAIGGTIMLVGCEDPAMTDLKPSFGTRNVADKSYVVGQAIAALTLPKATGGDGDLSYVLTPWVSGLSFDAATRTLTGTPTNPGSHEMTYTARDADDDTVRLTFTITVVEAPASPPAGTTDISVGSGGSVTLVAGTRSGEVSIFVVDQDKAPIVGAQYLNSANIEVAVRQVLTNSRSSAARASSLASAAAHAASEIRAIYRGGTAGEPISYVLTLDRSESMTRADTANMEGAARAFVSNVGTDDEGAVVNYATRAYLDQDLTTNASQLIHAINNPTYAGRSTALFDAIGGSVKILRERATNSRKAVICMTDGIENASTSIRSVAGVVNYANRASVPVHCVGLGETDEQLGAQGTLSRIAAGTGGLYYYSPTSSDLSDLYRKISQALSATWSVGFTSPVVFESGEAYEIMVTVTYPGAIEDSLIVTKEV